MRRPPERMPPSEDPRCKPLWRRKELLAERALQHAQQQAQAAQQAQQQQQQQQQAQQQQQVRS